MSLTIKKRILEKVNEIPVEGALDTNNTILNAWNHNLWKVASVIPQESMLAVAEPPQSWETSNVTDPSAKDMHNKLVLLVEREDANGDYRSATEIQQSQATAAQDSDSIFYATAYTPVYWFESRTKYNGKTLDVTFVDQTIDQDVNLADETNTDETFHALLTVTGASFGVGALDVDYSITGSVLTLLVAGGFITDEVITISYQAKDDIPAQSINVFPEADTGQGVRIYSYSKQEWDFSTDDYDLDSNTDKTVLFFPDHAIEVVILLTAVDLLKSLMALKALEDEDAELVQMVTAQMQSLEASVNREMEFLRPDIKADRNDN